MEPMTISQVAHALNKAENNLRRARDRHGKPGRDGATLDMTEQIAKEERRVDDWRRLLAFAKED